MLQYHSILGIKHFTLNQDCYAFYKYDGSNLRFEWSDKKGWSKFGSRTQMIDIKNPIFATGIEFFLNHIADDLLSKMKSYHGKNFKNIPRLTAFCEFYGKNSFAGEHLMTDEKTLKLFDVFSFQKGFLLPQDFIDVFDNTPYSAELVYQGPLNELLIEKVRYNTLPTLLEEGVICKGDNSKLKLKAYHNVWMTKIKTFEYINKLKAKYHQDWEKYI
jgi:hypothetical protein